MLGRATETDGSPPWAGFQSEGVRRVLLDRGFWEKVHDASTPPLRDPPGGTIVLAIQVPDVDVACGRITAAGGRIDAVPTDRPMMGLRNAMMRDPDGFPVELTTLLKPSKQLRQDP
jgi:hypothetical protein